MILTLIAWGVGFLVLVELARIVRHMLLSKHLGRVAIPFAYEHPSATKRILIIGDSTSYGTGTDVRTQAQSLGGRLAADMPGYSITNLSENAMSLKRLVEKINGIEGEFALSFIHIGGVDALSLTPLKTVRSRLTTAVDRAKQLTRGRVVVVSVNNAGSAPAFRFPLSQLYGHRTKQVSMVCDEVCIAGGVVHAPLWLRKETDPLPQDAHRLYARDGVHPNGEGYKFWYEKIQQSLL